MLDLTSSSCPAGHRPLVVRLQSALQAAAIQGMPSDAGASAFQSGQGARPIQRTFTPPMTPGWDASLTAGNSPPMGPGTRPGTALGPDTGFLRAWHMAGMVCLCPIAD